VNPTDTSHPPADSTREPPAVVQAARLFRERRHPPGSQVVHRDHGRGKVQSCRGTLRVVSFAVRTVVPVDQALRLGLVSQADVDAEGVAYVTMLEISEATVQCADLTAAEELPAAGGGQLRPCVVLSLREACS